MRNQSNKLEGIIGVTYRCHFRCLRCHTWKCPSKVEEEISLDVLKKLPEMAFANITGGEPFLRKDLFEIAKAYFTNTDIQSLFITTNGFFTDRIKGFLDEFVSSKIEGNVTLQFSIDNFEEEHDRNRRVKGLFRKTDLFRTRFSNDGICWPFLPLRHIL